MNARMSKRILLGSVMIAVMVGLLGLDWWLTRDVYDPVQACWQAAPDAATGIRAIPVAALFALLIVIALREMKGLCAASGIAILPISALVGCLVSAVGPFVGQLLPEMGPTQLTSLYLKGHPAQGAWLVVGLIVMLIFGRWHVR